MGQTLSRKPISQQQGFATLTGGSSANAPQQPQPDPISINAGFNVPFMAQQGPGVGNPNDGSQVPLLNGFQSPSVLGMNSGGSRMPVRPLSFAANSTSQGNMGSY